MIAQSANRNLGLDLVRATAISLVLLSHFSDGFMSWFQARPPIWVSMSGFFGVELFFVLSGFLIGGILIDLVSRDPSFREWAVFMTRRWMRTLPLYFLWLAVLSCLAPPPADLFAHLRVYAVMMQNFAWPMPADNWFGVSWSLAIEEWFYLSFSVFLFLTASVMRPRLAAWFVTGLFIVVTFVVRASLVDPATFAHLIYGTVIYHLDAIAYGVIIAIMRDGKFLRHAYVLLIAGLCLVAFSWIQESGNGLPINVTFFLTIFTSINCLGFALCIPAATRIRLPSFAAIPIRALSAQSYAIYIMHFTIFDLFSYQVVIRGFSPYLAMPLVLLTVFAVSRASLKLFEEPILRARPRQGRNYVETINVPTVAAAELDA